MNKKLSITIGVIVGIVVLGLFVLMISLDGIFTPKADKPLNSIEIEKDMRTVVIDNDRYLQNDNDNILIMFTRDYEKIVELDEGFLKLHYPIYSIGVLNFNSEDETFSILNIPTSTRTWVNKYNSVGQIIETSEKRIDEAYSDGNYKTQGCYNTLDSVRNYLYGLKFSQYVCLNYDCLSALLDYVGGVQIEAYLKEKVFFDINSENLESNLILASAILNLIAKKINSSSELKLEDFYDVLAENYDNLLTNCNEYTLRKIVRVLLNYSLDTNTSIEGKQVKEENITYFESDIEDLKNKVKALFYEKRED